MTHINKSAQVAKMIKVTKVTQVIKVTSAIKTKQSPKSIHKIRAYNIDAVSMALNVDFQRLKLNYHISLKHL